MPTQPNPKERPGQLALADDLKTAIAAIEGVVLIPSPKGNYYTVKLGKTTLGYVNGKTKLRVDFPMRDGKREQLRVEKKQQIAKAVKQLRAYEPKTSPTKNGKTKETKR